MSSIDLANNFECIQSILIAPKKLMTGTGSADLRHNNVVGNALTGTRAGFVRTDSFEVGKPPLLDVGQTAKCFSPSEVLDCPPVVCIIYTFQGGRIVLFISHVCASRMPSINMKKVGMRHDRLQCWQRVVSTWFRARQLRQRVPVDDLSYAAIRKPTWVAELRLPF